MVLFLKVVCDSLSPKVKETKGSLVPLLSAATKPLLIYTIATIVYNCILFDPSKKLTPLLKEANCN